MKYIGIKKLISDFLLRVFFLMTLSFLHSSCSSSTSLYVFYSGGIYPESADLLLQNVDSTYVYSYCYHRTNDIHKEFGKFSIQNDTIVLSPSVEVNEDVCEPYIHQVWYTSIEGDSAYAKEITKRYYLKTTKGIKDITLNQYYPNDSNANSFLESFPLEEMKIGRMKKERELLKRGKKLYPSVKTTMDVINNMR